MRSDRKIIIIGLGIAAVGFAVALWLADAPEDEGFDLGAARDLCASIPQPPVLSTHPEADHNALAALGKALFHDARFSRSRSVSCASCHRPERAFTDGLPVAHGVTEGALNTPSLVNAHLRRWLFWNGRAATLEEQALMPVESPVEHAFTRGEVADLLRENYGEQYVAVFGPFPTELPSVVGAALAPRTVVPPTAERRLSDRLAGNTLASMTDVLTQARWLRLARGEQLSPVEWVRRQIEAGVSVPADEHAARFAALHPVAQIAVNSVFANFALALAAFERTIRTTGAPFDAFCRRWLAAPPQPVTDGPVDRPPVPHTALTDSFGQAEWRGFVVFASSGRCARCHFGPSLSDEEFHNIGLPSPASEGGILPTQAALGRAGVMWQLAGKEYGCLSTYLKNITQSVATCRELEYLDYENVETVGAFKTPSLRQVAETAPYMHDGRFATLAAVVDHYGDPPDYRGPGHRDETLLDLALSDQERQDLMAFLRSLTGKVSSF